MSIRRHDDRSHGPLDDQTATEVIRLALGHRLREVRETVFGGPDLTALCDLMGVSDEQWMAYEGGGAMPTEIALLFIAATGVQPHWLLTGRGDRYRVGRWILQPHRRN